MLLLDKYTKQQFLIQFNSKIFAGLCHNSIIPHALICAPVRAYEMFKTTDTEVFGDAFLYNYKNYRRY